MSIRLEWNYKKQLDRLFNIVKRVSIIHIFLIVLALHLFIMSTPSEGFVFDESHYIPAAKDTVHFIAANAEHTPLSKLVIGWSITVFGDWWFGWRIIPVIFSSLSVIFVYLIAKEFMAKKYALFASVFVALDVLLFVNGSIAILDAQALFFALAGVYFVFKKKWGIGAVAFALAVLSKEIAVTILLGIALFFVLKKVRFRFKIRKPKFAAYKSLLVFASLFFLITFGGIYAYDIIYKPSSENVVQTQVIKTVLVDGNGSAVSTQLSTTNVTNHVYITNPIQHLIFAFTYYSGLTPTINPSAKDFRPAWSWALPLVNAGNPPQYYGVGITVGDKTTTTISYLSQVNYPVTIFVVPTLGLCFFLMFKHRMDQFSFLYVGWLIGTYLPWILFSVFVQKMTFNYYFMYTVPMLDIGAPWFISKLGFSERNKLIILAGLLLVTVVYFLYYFPINLFRA
jgi:4-amino-4-deoxy-L-arabinose transferase-like glycosyltransferase